MIANELKRREQQFDNAKRNFEDLSKEQFLLEKRISTTKKNLGNIAERLKYLEARLIELSGTKSLRYQILTREKTALSIIFADMISGLKAMEEQLQVTGGKYIDARNKCHELSHKIARDKVVLEQQAHAAQKHQHLR